MRRKPFVSVGPGLAVTLPEAMLVRFAPLKFVPDKLAPAKFTLVKFRFERLAPDKLAFAALAFGPNKVPLTKVQLVGTTGAGVALFALDINPLVDADEKFAALKVEEVIVA